VSPLELTSSDRIVVIAPHPDDESLACGGLIQQSNAVGAAVRVLLVTDGDNNPWPQRVMERRWSIGASQRAAWGRRRREEATAAVRRLGLFTANLHCAGLADQSLTNELTSESDNFRGWLRQQLAEFSPTIVVSPSMADCHSDHSAIAVLVRLTLRELSSPARLYEYLIHGSESNDAFQRSLRLSPDQVEVKADAIACHRTQTMLSRGRFMAHAKEIESFIEPHDDSHHPVKSITGDAAGWHIELGPARWRDMMSKVWLDVLGCDGPKILTHARVRATAHVLLPPEALRSCRQVFAKRSGGIGFFDEAGWREFSLV